MIDQLFGRLDQEPDIESDIAEMGNSDVEAESPEKPRKSRFFFGFAVFVIIMAVIGCISTVRFVAGVTGSLLDNTSLKNEFAEFIFPVVVNDIAPFESADDENSHTYTANKNIRYLTYSPKLISISKSSDVYTVVVGYLPPTVAAVAGVSGLSAQPEKYMEYTISRFDGKDTLLSVRFSDYQPQTEEAGVRE